MLYYWSILKIDQYVGQLSLSVNLSFYYWRNLAISPVCWRVLFVCLSVIISISDSSLFIIFIFTGPIVYSWRFIGIIVSSSRVKGQGHSVQIGLVSKNVVYAAKLKNSFVYPVHFLL